MNTKDKAVSGNVSTERALDLALEALKQLWLFGDEAAVITNPAITAIKQARSAPTVQSAERGEPVAHCEAGPNYCQQCHKESLPTYGSEEVRKLREVIKSQANIISSYESNYGKTSVNLLHGRERELLSWVSDSVVQVTPAAQRQWTELTDEERKEIYNECQGVDVMKAITQTEAELKAKNFA
jgi:hypothetical protein